MSEISCDQVTALEERLNDALELKLRLEGEVLHLLQSLSQGELHSEAAISALPHELLVSIFHLVLLYDDNLPQFTTQTLIQCLRLVCRAWNGIFDTNPSLWANFHTIVPHCPAHAARCTRYAKICMDRSGTSPLDIRIDFRSLDGVYERLIHDVQPKEIYPRWWDSTILNFGQSENPINRLFFHKYLDPLLAFSGGTGEEMMLRWRSCEILGAKFWRDGSVFREMFISRKVFTGPAPILERLVLCDWRTTELWNGLHTLHYSRWRGSFALPFPSLPRIRELVLTNVPISLDYAAVNAEQLERLDITCHDLAGLKFALRCKNLTRLRIGIQEHIDIWGSNWDLKGWRISYTRLTQLELHQLVPKGFMENIDAPMLRTIVFFDYVSVQTLVHFALLPSVTRVELRWSYMHDSWNSKISQLLRLFSRSGSRLTEVVIAEWGGDQLVAALKGLVKERGVVDYLREIVYINVNYNEDTRRTRRVDVDELMLS